MPPVAARPRAAAGDHTRVLQAAAPVDTTRVEAPGAAPASGAARRGARWVDGVGWVHEGPDPVPPGARWVVGVGYVLPDRGS